MKTQLALEKLVIISAVIAVALLVALFIYSEAYNIERSQSANYITDINFGNIYVGNNLLFITTKNSTKVGDNIMAYLKIKFANGTTITPDIKYVLQSSYATQDNEYIYEFNTTNLNLNLANVSQINISVVLIKTDNVSLEPEYSNYNHVVYYPTNAFSSVST